MHLVQGLVRKHPQITRWIALAVAMLVILFITTRDWELSPSEMATLAIITVVVAGLCVWIFHWELGRGMW